MYIARTVSSAAGCRRSSHASARPRACVRIRTHSTKPVSARFDASRANALGWLLMLCRSRALDRLRQRRATASALEVAALHEAGAAGPDQPLDILTLMQQRSTVHAALAQLTPERRHLISLAFLQGLSHQEIADVTRLPLGTVKSHVRRALTQLREALEAM